MRIDLLEKLVFVLTVFTVLSVGGGVTLVSMMPRGLRSGISNAAVNADDATLSWLGALRARKGRGPRFQDVFVPLPTKNEDGTLLTKEQVQKIKQKIDREAVAQYFAGGSDAPPIPKSEQVAHTPWLRRVPGVRYKPPRQVSALLHRKYQSFQDTWELVQEGGGEFVETDSGTAYKLNWIDPRSHLYNKLGLRQDDHVLAVNGRPVGKSIEAGKQMFEELKNERRFAVLLLRNGNKVVLSFTVPNR